MYCCKILIVIGYVEIKNFFDYKIDQDVIIDKLNEKNFSVI